MRNTLHWTQHPLTHIVEHTLGAFVVLLVAIGVAVATPPFDQGVVADADHVRPSNPTLHLAQVLPRAIELYWDGANDNVGVVAYRLFRNGELLAELPQPSFIDLEPPPSGTLVAYTVAAVDGSGNLSVPSSATYVVVPAEATSTDAVQEHGVYFSVTAAPVVDCTSGKAVHEVFFALSDIMGGSFLLSSPSNAVAEYPVNWGRQQLPGGTYHWKAVASPGFTVMGPAEGEFLLSGSCAAGSTVVPGNTESAVGTSSNAQSAAPLIAEVKPTLRFFVDSRPVAPLDYRFSGEEVELRVTIIRAKKVNFYAMPEGSSTPIELGVGVYDDLLSMKGTDVWSLDWKTDQYPVGEYKVFARVLLLTGSSAETLPALVRISPKDAAQPEPRALRSSTESQVDTEVLVLPRATIREAQVQNPGQCTDARSCRTYCASGVEARDACLSFAQTLLFTATSSQLTSLADGVSPDRIDHLLADFSKRPKDIPDTVIDARDFTAFCRNVDHVEQCTRILSRADLLDEEVLAQRATLMQSEAQMIQQIFEERVGVRSFVDSDGDHLSDYDERNIYGTDPDREDTDGDGFLDSEEIVVHTDPLGKFAARGEESITEEVRVEDARNVGVPAADILNIRRVVSMEVPGTGTSTRHVLKFTGSAPVNSYVTLFVFSEPIVVTTRANASGTWSYLLPHDIADGSHEAILGVVDAQGRVLARSATRPFVKEGSAVSVGEETLPSVAVASGWNTTPTVVALTLALLGVGFSLAGLFVHRKHVQAAARIILPKWR